ncbi:RlpA-like double-psi beta-barrel domain-containing protein [Sporobolomyces salmoneus]|uniref:RlpA-like double-psi beta-barrel domain-containing protein n=1 Tax=Sporobolomyces salmoneus TaxID=183962 RepID=UPI003181470C
MKFSLSTLVTLFSVASLSVSVSAACHRRRSIVPVVADGFNKVDRLAIFSPKEQVARRHQRFERRAARSSSKGSRGKRGRKTKQRNVTSSQAGGGGGQATATVASSPSSSAPAAAAASSTASAGSGSSPSGTFTGKATFFNQGGAFGACGKVSLDSDKVVALQTAKFGAGEFCGRTISIKNTETGATTTAVVADKCPGCATADSIDLSIGAFDAVGEQAKGVLEVEWSFV